MNCIPNTSGTAALAVPGTTGVHGRLLRQTHPIVWMQAVKPVQAVNAEPGSTAMAIFSEVKTSALRLAEQGITHSIDLRFLQSMPDERAALTALLGRGEVSAEVNSIGRSQVQETAIACVWLIRHFNSEAEMVGELIEITDIPEILVSDRQAVAHCLKVLNASALHGIN